MGFEYLNELLALPVEDIELDKSSALINVLAKADLNQLLDTLVKFQDKGIKLENSLSLLAYGLETSEEHLSLFNELRQLNDMSILTSLLINWVKISPTAVFERLNQIEDSAERKKLSDSAFFYWMYDSPEVAANYFLTNATNKLAMLKKIVGTWPDKKAADALTWISAQSGIDTNRFKIDYLKDLSRSDPQFVQAHLHNIDLDDNEKMAFYRDLYHGFLQKSSADAEQFLSTLPFSPEMLGITTEQTNPADTLVTKIDKAFRKYFDFKYEKAFALAIGNNNEYAYAYVVNKSSQDEANQLALSRCDKYRHQHNVESECKIYAQGDEILFELTP